jgi:hypothetical protein
VPPREGCRLPLSIGLLPLPVDPTQWRWPAPFAPRALPRFITTTEQSAPSQRIGTFSLAVGAACAFPLASPSRFSRSAQEPGRDSRRLHAGCHSGSIRTSPELIPEDVPTPGFDIVYDAFDTSPAVRLRSPLSTLPAGIIVPTFSATLTTTAFHRSSSRWLGISDLIAEPEGPTFVSGTVAHRRVDRRCS